MTSLRILLATVCLAFSLNGPATGQPQQPPPAAEAAKPADTLRKPDGSTIAVSYTIALVVTIVIMLLICVPARRE
ncbi:MAG: hypothetical protein FJ303_09320 [Planctomycetes bacterium]|nr:hypothetical protein [Planctomycetota bacterium]